MIAMSEKQVRECLPDAGCGKELIKQFEACQSSERQKDQLCLLDEYRLCHDRPLRQPLCGYGREDSADTAERHRDPGCGGFRIRSRQL